MQNLIKYDLRFQFNPVGSLKKMNSQCEADTKNVIWHVCDTNNLKTKTKNIWNENETYIQIQWWGRWSGFVSYFVQILSYHKKEPLPTTQEAFNSLQKCIPFKCYSSLWLTQVSQEQEL